MIFFIFHNMVMLNNQIKGNETYDKMQAHILPLHTLLTPEVISKGQNILCHVAYQIKGKVGHAWSSIHWVGCGGGEVFFKLVGNSCIA